jgi:hypothetical protein
MLPEQRWRLIMEKVSTGFLYTLVMLLALAGTACTMQANA